MLHCLRLASMVHPLTQCWMSAHRATQLQHQSETKVNKIKCMETIDWQAPVLHASGLHARCLSSNTHCLAARKSAAIRFNTTQQSGRFPSDLLVSYYAEVVLVSEPASHAELVFPT